MYLHSHPEKYPLKYEDGRISSQGNILDPSTFESRLDCSQVNRLLATPITIRTIFGKSYPPNRFLKLVVVGLYATMT